MPKEGISCFRCDPCWCWALRSWQRLRIFSCHNVSCCFFVDHGWLVAFTRGFEYLAIKLFFVIADKDQPIVTVQLTPVRAGGSSLWCRWPHNVWIFIGSMVSIKKCVDSCSASNTFCSYAIIFLYTSQALPATSGGISASIAAAYFRSLRSILRFYTDPQNQVQHHFRLFTSCWSPRQLVWLLFVCLKSMCSHIAVRMYRRQHPETPGSAAAAPPVELPEIPVDEVDDERDVAALLRL